jgi:hypothetical protein
MATSKAGQTGRERKIAVDGLILKAGLRPVQQMGFHQKQSRDETPGLKPRKHPDPMAARVSRVSPNPNFLFDLTDDAIVITVHIAKGEDGMGCSASPRHLRQ